MATHAEFKQWHGRERTARRDNNNASIARFCGYSAGEAPMEPRTKFGRYELATPLAADYRFKLAAETRASLLAKFRRAKLNYEGGLYQHAVAAEYGFTCYEPKPVDPTPEIRAAISSHRPFGGGFSGFAWLRMVEAAIAMDVAGRNAVLAWRAAA